MKKNNIIILSLLIFLTLGIVLFNYANQLTSLIAEAVAPNPGHSWSELECTNDLCVTSTGVGIGTASPSAKLHVAGNIIASDPTAPNHVATKDYVDNLPGLTWPDGGQPGNILTMGVTGPFWDSLLTWSGSNKSAHDCDIIGGTIYDTGATGTICKYPGSTVPTGWTQAANWQRYSPSSWGGDSCGANKSTGPATFANTTATLKTKGSDLGMCSDDWSCGRCSGKWASPYGSHDIGGSTIVTTYTNTTTNRVEIGIY